jgi:hypothetical protein
MNKEEAREVLQQQMSVYRQHKYVDLVSLIGDTDAFSVDGPSGAEYQIEIEVFWDAKPYEAVRAMGGIDDGGLSAFAPLTNDFIMDPDGSFVGE